MNTISYSLWGASKLYCQGAIENARLVPKIYGNQWMPRFYVAENCPAINALYNERCEVIVMPKSDYVMGSTTNALEHHNKIHLNMLWRNLALFDDRRFVLLRDTDSRINAREADSVFEWMNSGYPLHAIYDHEAHHNIVMPGLTGIDTRMVKQIYPNGIPQYTAALDKFYRWYSGPGFQQGLRFVHADIHAFYSLFMKHIGIDRLFCCGYNTKRPLRVAMPSDGSLGRFVGDVVNEAWRNEVYECR